VGDTVIVWLALQVTHTGPLETPFGIIAPTGKRTDAPCPDFFELENGKIKKLDCLPEGSVILTQLGVISNLEAALAHQIDRSRTARSPPALPCGRPREEMKIMDPVSYAISARFLCQLSQHAEPVTHPGVICGRVRVINTGTAGRRDG
jgi:hypothetical protein